MLSDIDKLLENSPEPESTARRLQQLREDESCRRHIDSLNVELLDDFLCIIGSSDFLFRFMSREPQAIALIGEEFQLDAEALSLIHDFQALRKFKYRALLRLSWMDICGRYDYTRILLGLSQLAEAIIRAAFRIAHDNEVHDKICNWMSVFALGKLGASELNFSSDVDLIFVSANAEEIDVEIDVLQRTLINSIQKVCQSIEEVTVDGFLYRVDLKLRPWGSSGPLCMSLDATEHYYEASSEPWERFAWLRSRAIAGSSEIASNLMNRLQPFVFSRSLSTEDLDRFIQIKQEMGRARKKRGHWNVKVGEGGIRDIEFFAQVLQIVNAGEDKNLQKTNTMEVLSGLEAAGILSAVEKRELCESYLFLRRLENRLQMVDERQTHELQDNTRFRLKIARSLKIEGDSNDEKLDNFENQLFLHRSIASTYFDRVLPQKT